MRRISFICYSRAAPQGSKSYLGNGIMVEACQRVKPYRSDLQGVSAEAVPVDWDMGLNFSLHVDFHFRRPKSHLTSKGALTKNAPLFPTGRQIGDTDKLLRSTCDAMTGIVWYDDCQVVDISAKKRFADRDQTIITITSVHV
jgi:Holliday junction resolvase RusA-like endonuclease